MTQYSLDTPREVAGNCCNLRGVAASVRDEAAIRGAVLSEDRSSSDGRVSQDTMADLAARRAVTTAAEIPDYSVFFRREFPHVARTVYLILRDQGRAEEVTQEAFILLLRHWRKVSSYDRPDAWVRRVAIRLAVRTSWRERRRWVLERQTVVTPGSEDSPPGVVEALRSLSAHQRAAIVLFYYEDCPIDEVAQILDCSQNTVKSHLHRGRSRLRALLGETYGGADGA